MIDAAVITRGGGGKQAIHEKDPPAYVIDANVAADADLLQLELCRTGTFSVDPPRESSSGWFMSSVVVRVGAKLRREVLGGHRAVCLVPPLLLSQVQSPPKGASLVSLSALDLRRRRRGGGSGSARRL